ncbi:MAG: site-specific integrase, partial [ANME-2 cluster archaeon]
PLKKVSPPKVVNNPREGISIDDVMKMVKACKTGMAERDKAILLSLVDAGCRANEFLSIDIRNMDLMNGEIKILQGKGGKFRTVYLGNNCRRMVRKYLKTRREVNPHSPLWVTNDGCRLTYAGLRQIIRRRADDTKIKTPGIQDFRRCFALEFLRNDGDIFTLQKILGHSSLEMVRRYLAIAKADCEVAHRKASPVDRWNGG